MYNIEKYAKIVGSIYNDKIHYYNDNKIIVEPKFVRDVYHELKKNIKHTNITQKLMFKKTKFDNGREALY